MKIASRTRDASPTPPTMRPLHPESMLAMPLGVPNLRLRSIAAQAPVWRARHAAVDALHRQRSHHTRRVPLPDLEVPHEILFVGPPELQRKANTRSSCRVWGLYEIGTAERKVHNAGL